VLARRAGTSYASLIDARVLRPLGMEQTGIALTPEMRERLVPGHGGAGNVVPNWDIPTLAGAGALRSNVNDMLRFLRANIEAKGALGEAMRMAQEPRATTDNPNLRVGLAWHVLNAAGRPITWHNGGTGGYHSFLAFDRARGVGVVILSSSNPSIDDIGLHILDDRIPLQGNLD
jgi:CubicO group peptidase (beta-lactamase class C family)